MVIDSRCHYCSLMLMETNSRYRLRTETGLRYHLPTHWLMQTRSHSLIHLLMVTSSPNPTRSRLQTRWLKATDLHFHWLIH